MSAAPLLGFFSMPGPTEMMIIGIIAVLLFGRRLPEVGRSLGQGIKQFKSGLAGIEADVDQAVKRPSRRSTSYDDDDREEATAPKFEPPTEQQENAAV